MFDKEFKTILEMSQDELKEHTKNKLMDMGYDVTVDEGFVYGEGEIPVMLVAHLDTVHTKSCKGEIFYNEDKQTLVSPNGIGGDDRCGIYMILEIVKNLKCHVLFCEEEEVGGVGAELFTISGIIPKINYIIELDRRDNDDSVFYDNDNRKFEDFINSFDFTTRWGSFSDISTIAPFLGVSAVNLSCGYYNPHSTSEYIDLNIVNKNINKVCQIVETKTDFFEYVAVKTNYNWYKQYNSRSYKNEYDDYDDYESWYTSSPKDKDADIINGEVNDINEYENDCQINLMELRKDQVVNFSDGDTVYYDEAYKIFITKGGGIYYQYTEDYNCDKTLPQTDLVYYGEGLFLTKSFSVVLFKADCWTTYEILEGYYEDDIKTRVANESTADEDESDSVEGYFWCDDCGGYFPIERLRNDTHGNYCDVCFNEVYGYCNADDGNVGESDYQGMTTNEKYLFLLAQYKSGKITKEEWNWKCYQVAHPQQAMQTI